ncbi:MAG: tetratricopeptide repeat protein [Planctomycetota bacterium]
MKTFICLLVFMAILGHSNLQGGTDEDPLSKEQPAALDRAAMNALQERLLALEQEEQELKELAARLKDGYPVDVAELWKSWLPPAVYLTMLSESSDSSELTGAAAEITRDLLDEKDAELDQLLRLKSEVEGGGEVSLEGLAEAETMGMDGRANALLKQEEELEKLRRHLEGIHFQERFQRSADLDEELGDDDQVRLPAMDREGKATAASGDEENADDPSREETAENSMPNNLLKVAETCYRLRRYQRAWDVFEKIDTASHEDGDRILYMIGRCREHLEDLKGAKEAYQHLKKVYPGSFWSKQADFAIATVNWKMNLGPIKGPPEEVYRVLTGNLDPKKPESTRTP